MLASSQGGPGYVARRGGNLAGYLLHTPITEGPHAGFAWADLNDHAAVDAETSRSLYAHAAQHWVEAGLRQHVVHVPAVDALLWPWFATSFGVQHTWSLRDTAPLALPSGVEGLVVRRIGRTRPPPSDRPTSISPSICAGRRRSARSPSHRTKKQSLGRASSSKSRGSARWSPSGTVHTWATERSPRTPRRNLRAPAGSAIFGIVVVDAGARGSGIGRTVTSRLLDWARAEGYEHALCDWAATNVQSSRAFTSFGWRPTFYRLYRVLPTDLAGHATQQRKD